MHPLSTVVHEFEGKSLVTFTWQGRPCWVARHLGAILGQSHDGKRLPNKILGDWSDEFVPGHDFTLLHGDDLTAFQTAARESGIYSSSLGRGSLLILFTSGALLALTKSNSEPGKDLRRFMVDKVLPQIVQTGRYVPEPELGRRETVEHILLLFPEFEPRPVRSLIERREERLVRQASTAAARVELGARRLGVFAVHRMIDMLGDLLDRSERASLEILAAEIATGLPMLEIVGGMRDEPPPTPPSKAADVVNNAA